MDLGAIAELLGGGTGTGSGSTAETITSFAAILSVIINLLKGFLAQLGIIEEETTLPEETTEG